MKNKVVSSRVIFSDRWTTLRQEDVVWDNGISASLAVIEKPPGATVVAIDDDGLVHLAREYRHALGCYSIEGVSGALEGRESPQQGAARELEEELGLIAADWTQLALVHPFTTAVRSPNYVFLARRLAKGIPKPDPTESVSVIKLPLLECIAMIVRGEISHAATCVGLLMAERKLRPSV